MNRRPHSIPTSFSAMTQAASITKIPYRVWRKAKRLGAPGAFKGHRVYLLPFLEWFFARATEEDDRDWHKVLKRAQALREEMRLDADAGRMVDRQEVEQGLRSCLAEFFGAFERTFCSELPPILQGLDARSIASKSKTELEALKTRLRERFLALAGPAGPP